MLGRETLLLGGNSESHGGHPTETQRSQNPIFDHRGSIIAGRSNRECPGCFSNRRIRNVPSYAVRGVNARLPHADVSSRFHRGRGVEVLCVRQRHLNILRLFVVDNITLSSYYRRVLIVSSSEPVEQRRQDQAKVNIKFVNSRRAGFGDEPFPAEGVARCVEARANSITVRGSYAIDLRQAAPNTTTLLI